MVSWLKMLKTRQEGQFSSGGLPTQRLIVDIHDWQHQVAGQFLLLDFAQIGELQGLEQGEAFAVTLSMNFKGW